jgi:hypothetical protein
MMWKALAAEVPYYLSYCVYTGSVWGISRLQSNGMFVLTDASLGLLIECWQQRQILVSNTRFTRFLHEHSISVFLEYVLA